MHKLYEFYFNGPGWIIATIWAVPFGAYFVSGSRGRMIFGLALAVLWLAFWLVVLVYGKR